MDAFDALPLEIDCAAVQALREQGEDLVLLDCREPPEHALVHIDGCILIPMSEMEQRVGDIPVDATQRIVVYCHLGGRSLQVTQWLRSQGFSHAQNMTGGIDAWSMNIDPLLPRY